MAEIPPGPTEPLDVQRIHYLARLMKRYDLTSLDLADGQVQIRLRRRGPEISPIAAGLPSQPAIGPRTGPPSLPAAAPSTASAATQPPPARRRRRTSRAPWSGPTIPPAPRTPPRSSRSARSSIPDDRLHHRGDEGLHRYPRRRLRHDRRDPGEERPGGRIRPAPVPRDPS